MCSAAECDRGILATVQNEARETLGEFRDAPIAIRRERDDSPEIPQGGPGSLVVHSLDEVQAAWKPVLWCVGEDG